MSYDDSLEEEFLQDLWRDKEGNLHYISDISDNHLASLITYLNKGSTHPFASEWRKKLKTEQDERLKGMFD